MAGATHTPLDPLAASMIHGVRFGPFWTAVVSLLARAATAVCYGRLRVLGGPLPAGRPALLIANHPAAWSDVVVLIFGLNRRLHFLAQRQLFRPATRAWFLRLYGSLPVMVRADSPEAPAWNAAIFRACQELFDHGESVAMFPEGASVSDRSVRPFKPGFARLLLEYSALPGRAGRLALVPVGIHYQDRAAFRSDVELVVGPTLELPDAGATAASAQESVDALVARALAAVSRLVVNMPDPEQEALVRELEPIVLPEWRGARDIPDVSLARELAASVTAVCARDPAALDRLWMQVKEYSRCRIALGVADDVLGEVRPRHRLGAYAARVLGVAAGTLPMLLVASVNILPHVATVLFARRFAPQSNRLMFARLGFGAVAFVVHYAFWGLVLWRATRWPLAWLAVLFVGMVAAGVATLAYGPWFLRQWARLRLAWLEHGRPDDVSEARASRAALLASLAGARRLAHEPATGGTDS